MKAFVVSEESGEGALLEKGSQKYVYLYIYKSELNYWSPQFELCRSMIVQIYGCRQTLTWLRGNCTQNQNWTCFVSYLKIINTALKNNKTIQKRIAWETQKWHWNFNKPKGTWVIDQNNILHVLINNSRTAWHTKISMPFVSFSDKLLLGNQIIFPKKSADNVWDSAQNVLNFGLGAVPL